MLRRKRQRSLISGPRCSGGSRIVSSNVWMNCWTIGSARRRGAPFTPRSSAGASSPAARDGAPSFLCPARLHTLAYTFRTCLSTT
eukprot:3421154-Prymnesium_polylepis.1